LDKAQDLKIKLQNQQFLFTKPNTESELSVKMSYTIAGKNCFAIKALYQ
jgi:hypothetical protein